MLDRDEFNKVVEDCNYGDHFSDETMYKMYRIYQQTVCLDTKRRKEAARGKKSFVDWLIFLSRLGVASLLFYFVAALIYYVDTHKDNLSDEVLPYLNPTHHTWLVLFIVLMILGVILERQIQKYLKAKKIND